MKTRLFLTGLALMAFIAAAYPQANTNNKPDSKVKPKGSAFVDKNNDGICDNFQERNKNVQNKNNRGCGRCNGTGKGPNYVDNNKDGICDHYQNRNNTNNKPKGKGNGRGFVDANNNGICDYRENQ